MKFSIIMASYNCEDVIDRAIVSVVNQTYTSYELVIIDGKSNDDTIKIIKEYSDKYDKIKFKSEEDNGIYDALNKGIILAEGEYIVIMGSDDELINNHILEDVANSLDDNIDFLSAPVIMVMREYNLESIFSNKNKESMPHQGVFVKSEIMKNRLFDLSFPVSADSNFILDCLYDDSIKKKFVDFPVMYYTLGGFSSNNILIQKDWQILREKYNLPKIKKKIYIKSKIKTFIKLFLQEIGLFSFVMILSGKWKRHNNTL